MKNILKCKLFISLTIILLVKLEMPYFLTLSLILVGPTLKIKKKTFSPHGTCISWNLPNLYLTSSSNHSR